MLCSFASSRKNHTLMSPALEELIGILTLDELGNDEFRGRGSHSDGADGTYGGHFLGQATAAALATVDDDRFIHSLHAYFIRGGRPGQPIEYAVERVRDGRSFCTRRVRASQDGKTAFELLASFTVEASSPTIDAATPPDLAALPPPESLPRYHELMASTDPLPFPAEWALREHGVDVRVVNAPWSPNGPSEKDGIRMWIKADGTLPASPKLHTAMMAYQSDESISDNVLVPLGVTWGTPGVFFVSLDHALWFHRPIDLNQWHLVDQWVVTATEGRGTSTGFVWSAEGSLIASFTQEALLRIDPPTAESQG